MARNKYYTAFGFNNQPINPPGLLKEDKIED